MAGHDVAHHAVVLQRIAGQVLAVAGTLEAAMGHLADQHEVAVDPGAAVLQASGDLHGLVQVAGPHRRGQAVFGVVGPIHRGSQFVEAGDGDHRAEHLALDDFVGLFAAGEQGRLVIEAGAGMHGGAGHPLDMRLAKGALDETGHPVALTGADQRADLVVRVGLAGKAQAAHGITQLRD
ncbi:hypothetical protein D3C84_603920 [compost metagenome]